MQMFLWFCLTLAAIDIIGRSLVLKEGRYPRVTLSPIYDKAGNPAQMEARKQTATHDRKKIVLRFAVVLWLMYLLTN